MKKKVLVTMSTIAMVIVGSMTAYAGEWKQDNIGWRYQNDDGSYSANSWQWIDGNNDGIAESYYFDGNGYLLVNATTPDGYQVNENGAWIKDSIVQKKNSIPQNDNGEVNESALTISDITELVKYLYMYTDGDSSLKIQTILTNGLHKGKLQYSRLSDQGYVTKTVNFSKDKDLNESMCAVLAMEGDELYYLNFSVRNGEIDMNEMTYIYNNKDIEKIWTEIYNLEATDGLMIGVHEGVSFEL